MSYASLGAASCGCGDNIFVPDTISLDACSSSLIGSARSLQLTAFSSLSLPSRAFACSLTKRKISSRIASVSFMEPLLHNAISDWLRENRCTGGCHAWPVHHPGSRPRILFRRSRRQRLLHQLIERLARRRPAYAPFHGRNHRAHLGHRDALELSLAIAKHEV